MSDTGVLRHSATAQHRLALSQLAVAGVALAAWELLSITDLNANTVPTVDAVLRKIAELLMERATWTDIANTFAGWAVSLSIAVVAAVPLGIALGRRSGLYRSSRFTIDFLRTVPGLAIIPLASFMFGTSLATELIIVVPTCFWPLLLQTIYGARDVEALLFDVSRAYGFTRRKIFTRVVLPSCAGYAATGLRLAATMGLIATIGTELIAGTPGLGFGLASAQAVGDDLKVYAYTLMISVIGFGMTLVLTQAERRAIPWRVAERAR